MVHWSKVSCNYCCNRLTFNEMLQASDFSYSVYALTYDEQSARQCVLNMISTTPPPPSRLRIILDEE